jgi:N-acyl homoserine lactone hydrolase
MIEVHGSRRLALLLAVFRNQRTVLSGSRQTLRIVMSGVVRTGNEGPFASSIAWVGTMKIGIRTVLLYLLLIIVVTVLSLVSTLFIGYYGRRPLPMATHRWRVAPTLAPLPEIQVCWIETGHAFGSGTFSMTASGLLIRHPKGDVLIDGGNSSYFDQEASQFPLWQRLVISAIPGQLKPRINLLSALHAVGETPTHVRWLIPSHAHLDHVGGYEDLPRIPVLLSPLEMEFLHDPAALRSGAVIPQQAQMLEDGRAIDLKFFDSPYETYAQSLDLYSDGSIIVVPLPGHTPGSVGVFINLDANHRLFYLGDAALQASEVAKRIKKPFFIQDIDPQQAAEEVQELNELHRLLPELAMVPAHGRSDYFRVFPEGPETCTSNTR